MLEPSSAEFIQQYWEAGGPGIIILTSEVKKKIEKVLVTSLGLMLGSILLFSF